MRTLVAILILMMLASPALAAEYLTVFPQGSSAADVVTAANFAASMKATLGVEFSAKTLDQAAAEADFNHLDRDVYVLFDGSHATIASGTDADPQVARIAREYLEGQGLRVSETSLDRDFLGVDEETQEEQPQACPDDTLKCWDGSILSRDPLTCEFPDCPTQPVVVAQTPEPEHTAPAVPEAPPVQAHENVFVRVWHWFSGLFS